MSDIEFLVDENILGLARYLETFDIKFRSIGDKNCPEKGSDDPTVAKFAHKENLVVLTSDEKLKKQCDLFDVKCFLNDLTGFAKKVREYADTH